jgi:hypothetical protein
MKEVYKVTPITSIIFSYGIRKGEIIPTINSITKNITKKYQIYYNNQLPLAIFPEEYGTILNKIDNNYTISVKKGRSNAIIILNVIKDNNHTINNIKYFKNNNLLFS